MLTGDESAATEAPGAAIVGIFAHSDNPEEKRLFSRSFSPHFFIFNKISSFAKNTWRYHLNLLCGKPMTKTVYLGIELVKNKIIVLSFIELLVLDPKQSINMKVDE